MSTLDDLVLAGRRHDKHGRRILTAIEEDQALTGDDVFAGGTVRGADLTEQVAIRGVVPTQLRQRTAAENIQPIRMQSFDEDAAPFSVQMQSYANSGAGAGTRNTGVWMGFNVGHYAQGETIDDVSGIYMGFENNYFDEAGADTGEEKYGPEWYVGYTSPDGETIGIADLRPFYVRVKGGRVDQTALETSCQVWTDIGGGPTGFYGIFHGQVAQNEIAIFNKDTIYLRKQTVFSANAVPGVTVRPLDAQFYAQMELDANHASGVGVIAFKTQSVLRWTLVGGAGEFYVTDGTNLDRKQFQLLPGATPTASTANFFCRTVIKGEGGSLSVEPASGYAQIDIKAPGVGGGGDASVLAFWRSGSPRFSLAAGAGELYVEDITNSNRKHLQMLPGASDTAASTIFKSNLQIMGNVGFYGGATTAKQTVTGSRGGNAALASLLTALAAVGLITNSSTA